MTDRNESLRLLAGAAHRGALSEPVSDLPEDAQDHLLCDACGGPCNAVDAVIDRTQTIVLCGAVYGNGCDRWLDQVEAGEDLADLLAEEQEEEMPCPDCDDPDCDDFHCPICGSKRCNGYCL